MTMTHNTTASQPTKFEGGLIEACLRIEQAVQNVECEIAALNLQGLGCQLPQQQFMQHIAQFSYVLSHLHLLACLHKSDAKQHGAAIALLQKTPMYSHCCTVLAKSSTLSKQWEELCKPPTAANHDAYVTKCHQCYAEILNYLPALESNQPRDQPKRKS